MFTAIYKRLLVRHHISASQYGNCAILGAMSILPVSNTTDNIVDDCTYDCADNNNNNETVPIIDIPNHNTLKM
ncbi:hypothetical protein X777_16474 [Ooceraea biroi]|uniref:Uncharacterized protein n=1 Tax=Ooceraea biroi TaxID=2015173 RepID=A0A026VU06_OOCBI|nr:hypothetical protein X777_16474 [Ooceraea biroi]